MKKKLLLLGAIALAHVGATVVAAQLQPHEAWWTDKMATQYEAFNEWVGGEDAPSRKALREHVQEKGYETFLDCACGSYREYFGFVQDGIAIDYQGMDITQPLVDLALDRGLKAVQGSIEKIPFEDSTFDIVNARQILEILTYYEVALTEMIRTAKKEVSVTFFMNLHAGKDRIKTVLRDNYPIHYNNYNKQKMESFILSHDKVARLEWQDMTDHEITLHIYLR